MTEKDIRSLSKEDAVERLLQFYSDEYKISMYLTFTEKMQEITTALETYTFMAHDEKFEKNVETISKLAERSIKITESLDAIRESIDKEALRKAKEERTKAKSGTVEDLIKRVNNAKS